MAKSTYKCVGYERDAQGISYTAAEIEEVLNGLDEAGYEYIGVLPILEVDYVFIGKLRKYTGHLNG